MARETIFTNTTLSPFVEYPMFNLYGAQVESELSVQIDETYTIEWDGQTHECVAQDASALIDGAIVLGNAEDYNLDGNGEPFVIVVWDYGVVDFMSLTDTQEGGIHTVAIYKGVAEKVGIVLKDRDGNKNYYNPPNGVRFEMGDGNKQLFVNATDLPKAVSVTVKPDFTGGKDMTVVPESGTQFSEVIVEKPENLISEYIKEGIKIAGITGELEGGGAVKVASGVFAGNDGTVTVTHGLGVVPDVVLVYGTTMIGSVSTESKYCIGSGIGFSANFVTKNNLAYGMTITQRRRYSGSYQYYLSNFNTTCCVDRATEHNIYGATTQTVSIGYSTTPTSKYHNYEWVAIGGLT